MSITISDPVLLAEIGRLSGIVDVNDPQGHIIAALTIPDEGKLPPGMKSPFTDEEMAERRKDRTGRPLADILRDLEARQ